MLAVLLVIDNHKNNPIKIDTFSSHASDNSSIYRTMHPHEAIKRVLITTPEAVATLGILFGPIVGLIAGAKQTDENILIEDYFWEKSFKPTLINSKKRGVGLIFFNIPKKAIDYSKLTYNITVIDLATNKNIPIQLPALQPSSPVELQP